CCAEGDATAVESLPPEDGEQLALAVVPSSSSFGISETASRALHRVSDGTGSRGSVGATRALLERWSATHPVAAGVRYPVISEGTAAKVDRYVTDLDRSSVTPSTATFFGRHPDALLAFQDWARRSHLRGPFQALVVGAGFGPTMNRGGTPDAPLPFESIAVLEWLGLLGQSGADFRLDVIDPSGEIANYFSELSRAEEHTFFVADNPSPRWAFNTIPETFPAEVFGRYATDVTGSYPHPLPEGARHVWRVTFPRSLLQRLRFVHGNVLAPLPGTDYDLIDYHAVRMYVPRDLWINPGPNSPLIDLDIANLLMNLRPGGWLMTGRLSSEAAFQHEVVIAPSMGANGHAYRVSGLKTELPFLERQRDGSWPVHVHSDDNGDGSRGHRISYRRSPGSLTFRDTSDGDSLLGTSGLLEGGAAVIPDEAIRSEALPRGASEPSVLPRPARRLVIP
ncbi:MAG: hypothetical protein Q7S98_04430, partial [Deltaproteobacteria bacterium]|nr:hypothetical protein [Deltaproteobacteria bacterium]